MRSARDVERVAALLADGWSDADIALHTGIPRRTVNGWRRGDGRRADALRARDFWRPGDERGYSYLLGLYLGDGCVVRRRYSRVLCISLDGLYPGIVQECIEAVAAVVPERPVRVVRVPGSRVARVESCSKLWLTAFPQYGPGRKHDREIRLAPWQKAVVDDHPCEFLRGLLHSDGCRTVNRFSTALPSGRVGEYEYVRYFFSNKSADSGGSSAPTASCSASGGRSRTRATSRSPTAGAWPCSTPSSGRRHRAVGAALGPGMAGLGGAGICTCGPGLRSPSPCPLGHSTRTWIVESRDRPGPQSM